MLQTIRLHVTACALGLAALGAPLSAQVSADGSVGLLGLRATTLEYDGREDAGNFFGLGGELLLNGRWVGVAQAEFLQASSLSEDAVNSAFGLMGGLGVRLGIPGLSILTVDVMGYGGYAQLSYNNGNADFTDASPQFGFGLTPRLRITERLAVALPFRVLSGSDVGEGTAINRTDVGVVGWLRLF